MAVDLINSEAVSEIVKKEVQELLKKYLAELKVWWDIKTFADRCCCGKGRDWIVKNILDPHRDEIDVKNGGWCRYQYGGRSSYQFIAKEACAWIEKHAHEIDWDS